MHGSAVKYDSARPNPLGYVCILYYRLSTVDNSTLRCVIVYSIQQNYSTVMATSLPLLRIAFWAAGHTHLADARCTPDWSGLQLASELYKSRVAMCSVLLASGLWMWSIEGYSCIKRVYIAKTRVVRRSSNRSSGKIDISGDKWNSAWLKPSYRHATLLGSTLSQESPNLQATPIAINKLGVTRGRRISSFYSLYSRLKL
jgi:hypothetical protein